jgi:hypothetical protein
MRNDPERAVKGLAMTSLRERLISAFVVLGLAMACAQLALTSRMSFAAAEDGKQKASTQAAKPRSFATPELAMQALAAAVKAGDMTTLRALLGTRGEAVLDSGDPVEDKASRERFTAAYEEAHKIDEKGAKAWIVVGKDEWPLPIPLLKYGSAWYFDARQGKEELLNRRIGRNELYTIQSVLAYVDAQQDYYQRNPQNDKLLQYAQKFISSSGKRDGLYFPTKAGEKPSPLGPLFDARRAAGYVDDAGGKPAPYHGYYYKILKGQGPKAAGGAYDYIVNGKMIGGFALLAYPATYGNSGIMTFMVNQDGVVYEKNLGPKTAAAAQKITRFNPDETWTRHEPPK